MASGFLALGFMIRITNPKGKEMVTDILTIAFCLVIIIALSIMVGRVFKKG